VAGGLIKEEEEGNWYCWSTMSNAITMPTPSIEQNMANHTV
jgi:hypothetical protein